MFRRPHYPSCTADCNLYGVASSVAVQMPWPPPAQLWEPLLHKHNSSQTVENLKRLVVSLAFCRCCFCFYCCGIHDSLMNRGPVSDGPLCPRCSRLHIIIGTLLGVAHTLRNSVASRPPDARVCFSPMSTVLFSQRAATTEVCACCLNVRRVGREGVVCAVSQILQSLWAIYGRRCTLRQMSDYKIRLQCLHTCHQCLFPERVNGSLCVCALNSANPSRSATNN